MTTEELFLSFLTKVFNKTEDEVKPLIYNDKGEINETAFETVLSFDTARVKRLKDEGTLKFDNGYKKAQSEILKDNEALLKETFGIHDDLSYPELLIKAKELSTAKNKLTTDDVKKHPDYLALEATRVKKEDYEKVVSEFDTYKKNIDRTMKIGKVIDRATVTLDKFNPDFTPYADAPAIKANLLDAYRRSFEQFDDFEITDTNIIPIKDGKRVEDEHGNPISFETLCKQNAGNYFKFLKQTPRGSSGNTNEGSGGQQEGLKFQSKQEMVEAYGKLTDPTQQKEFIEKTKNITFA